MKLSSDSESQHRSKYRSSSEADDNLSNDANADYEEKLGRQNFQVMACSIDHTF